MHQEQGLSVETKMAAIVAQSPDLDSRAVKKTAEREVGEGKAIWGAVDFKVRWYPIEGESREQMKAWKSEIEGVLLALQKAVDSGDLTEFIEASKGSVKAEQIWEMVGAIKQQAEESGIELDPEARKLLAIDLWIRREQGGRWKKETLRRSFWRVATGQGSKIADVLDRDKAPNCIDVAYLIKALGHEFDIDGEVGSIPSSTPGIDHRYFETASGKILDYWYLPESGGLALSKDVYKKLLALRKQNGHGHRSKQEK